MAKTSAIQQIAPTKRTGWVLVITSILGLFASMMLSISEIKHLKEPAKALTCDVNPLIGCSSILDTWQGHLIFGIPNQFFGLVAFAVMLTLGILVLAKVQFPKWIWWGLQAGAVAGIISVLWFIYQSLFVLDHLCPYCMVTWVATFISSWYITVHNAHMRVFRLKGIWSQIGDFIATHHLDIIITLFVILIFGILLRFRDFFFG